MPKLTTDRTPCATPRLRANQKEGLGSRGGAEARSSADRFELITKKIRYAAT